MAALIISPIPQEFDVLARVFDERYGEHQERETGRAVVREYLAGGVVLSWGGLGKVQFAVTTQHLLETLPDIGLVVCAGVGVQDLRLQVAVVVHRLGPGTGPV